MMHDQTIDLFKVVVLADNQKVLTTPYLGGINRGYTTDFEPNAGQDTALNKAFKALSITTLFTVAERNTADPLELISKQLAHYFEVYGLGMPGLFNLEVTNGKVLVFTNISGVTKDELGHKVRTLLYANAPIRKLEDLIEIINFYMLDYDLELVANNEARVRLYREGDKFSKGDDAVRYIIYKITDDSMVIKSKKVLAAIKAGSSRISLNFLLNHESVLSQVFNRHKRIIMSLKDKKNATIINKISRHSKTRHVPIIPAINKTFIAKALKGEIKAAGMIKALTDHITLRDKFKYLNLIEWRRLGRKDDVFIIRNGKSHLVENRPVYSSDHLDKLSGVVFASIEEDLAHLKGKSILLDANVDYGLPTTQKQMLGNLPFGTEVSVGGNTISSGIYWEDRGGAYDLDLSTVDQNGVRTGWGGYGGYDRSNPVTFSGDITSAPNGAMEFMTSRKDYNQNYGLFINIYNGKDGAECSLVVGHQTIDKGGKTRHGDQQQWIEDPIIREKFNILSKGCIVGFVRGGKFVVYALRTSNSRISGGKVTQRLVAKALAPAWTLSRLFDAAGVSYDTTATANKKYDYDLRYGSFSVDKLEDMLFNR